MSGITLEFSALTDPRIIIAAKRLGVDPGAVGWRLAKVWAWCTEASTYYLDVAVLDELFAMSGLVGELLKVQLLKDVNHQPVRVDQDGLIANFPERVYVSGTAGRVEWLEVLRKQSKRASKARTEQALRLRKEKASGTFNSRPVRVDPSALLCSTQLYSEDPPVGPPSGDPPTNGHPSDPGLAAPDPAPASPAGQLGGPNGSTAPVQARLGLQEAPGSPRTPDPAPAAPKRPKRPPRGPSASARRLWQLQDDLRAEVLPGSRPLDAAPDRLARIDALLDAGRSEAACEAVLQEYARECRQNPAARQWFDGVTNWRPDNFDRALGRAGVGRDISRGHYDPGRNEHSDWDPERDGRAATFGMAAPNGRRPT